MKLMKKILYIFLMATVCASCDFLDTKVYDNPEGDQQLFDETSCMAGLTGVYDVLGFSDLYGQNLWGDLDAGSDILYHERSYNKDKHYVSLKKYNNTDQFVNGTWKALYIGINRANDFLRQLENLSDAQCGGKKNMFEAEARALRALYYMNLVAYWGEAPLRLETTMDLSHQLLKKAPQKELYEQIFKDLAFGAGEVDSEGKVVTPGHCWPADKLNTPGRISQTTAQALLARAYLWYAGYPTYGNTWQEARNYALAVMKSNLHDLNKAAIDMAYTNGYHSVFINMCSNRYDLTARESMFEVEFYGNGLESSNESGKVGLYNGIQQTATYDPDVPYAYGFYRPTHILMRLYDKKYAVGPQKDPTEKNDARKWWNIADYTWQKNNEAKKVTKKFFTESDKSTKDNLKSFPGKWRAEYDPVRPWARNNSSINFPVMRYSDVLLMFAEAEVELNNGATQEAVDAINLVRERAGASSIALGDKPESKYANNDPSDISTLEGMRKFIFEERTRELCYELPRHMELRRHGKEFFMERIRLLISEDEYPNSQKHIIGYDRDDVAAVPAINLEDKHIYLPIPQCELNTNTICGQNAGW